MKSLLLFMTLLLLPFQAWGQAWGGRDWPDFSDFIDIVGGMFRPLDEPLDEALGPSNCHGEEVLSANPDPIITPGNCHRTICEGNFWGKSATDVCHNGEIRTIGEGENEQRVEIIHVRQPFSKLAREGWSEMILRRVDGPSEASNTKNKIDDSHNNSTWDNFVISELHATPAESVSTPWSLEERNALAYSVQRAVNNMYAAIDSGDERLIGPPHSEYRVYFYIALEAARFVLHSLIGTREFRSSHHDNLELLFYDYLARGVPLGLVWRDIGGGAETSRLGPIVVDDDYRQMGMSATSYVGLTTAPVIHEAVHIVNYFTGRTGSRSDAEDGAPMWHDESTAFIAESIFYKFMWDFDRIMMQRVFNFEHLIYEATAELVYNGSASTARMHLGPDPSGSPRLFQYLGRAVMFFQYSWNPETIAQHPWWRRVFDAVTDSDAEAEAMGDRFSRGAWTENDIRSIGAYYYYEARAGEYTLRPPASPGYATRGQLYLLGYEDDFRTRGGVFSLWPECVGYMGTEEEEREACESIVQAAHPSLKHDHDVSPDVPPDHGPSSEREPPDDDYEYDEPERADTVGSSERENGIPPDCLDLAAGRDHSAALQATCTTWCLENITDGYDGDNGLCTQITNAPCRGASPPPHCAERCREHRDPYCFDACEDHPGLEWCGDLCPEGDRNNSECDNLCESHNSYGFCGSLCRENPDLSWCDDRCADGRGWGAGGYCEPLCVENPNQPFCVDRCASEDRDYCRTLCGENRDQTFCSRYPESPEGGGGSGSGEEDTSTCVRGALDLLSDELWPFLGQVCHDSSANYEPGGPRDNDWVGCWANGTTGIGWGVALTSELTGYLAGGDVSWWGDDYAYGYGLYCLYTCVLGTTTDRGLPACWCVADSGAVAEGACYYGDF
ncbi:MAG: hypothetical protein HYT76_08990 [Deltaproteobacteria bacterium]|nr:hypothetical protein [Deltaproteobacteria bacterium]